MSEPVQRETRIIGLGTASGGSTPIIPFDPVPLRARHDGWTAHKQVAFIEALAESGCVEEACRRVGMSDSAAYRLRRRPCGAPFRDAWDTALDYALHRLEQAALARALNGVPRPVFHKGEQVGEWRHHDERLTMFLLSHRRRNRFGKWINREQAPELFAQEDADDSLHDALQLVAAEVAELQDADESAPDSCARVEE